MVLGEWSYKKIFGIPIFAILLVGIVVVVQKKGGFKKRLFK